MSEHSSPGNAIAMTDRERAIQAIRRGVPLGQAVMCSCHTNPPTRNGCFGVCEDSVAAIVASYEAVRREAAVPAQGGTGGDVTALGKQYLEKRVSSMQEAVDREEWRQNDGDAHRAEYWIGRLHEAKIALTNLTVGLERHGDYFVKKTPALPSTERHCEFCHVPMSSADCCDSEFESKGCPHSSPERGATDV